MQTKNDDKWNKNILYKAGRFLLVLYAAGMLGTLGLSRSSWPAFVGIALFTCFFLKYTDDIDKNVYDSYQKRHTIIFAIICGIILLLGLDFMCRRSEIKIPVIELLISMPGMIILIHRGSMLTGFWGGICPEDKNGFQSRKQVGLYVAVCSYLDGLFFGFPEYVSRNFELRYTGTIRGSSKFKWIQ